MAALRHVGVVGAGLAGLTAALAAALAGLHVDVFEAQAKPDEWAAHIEVVPNLLRDLDRLGVGASCVRRGFPYQGFAVLDGDGRTLFEIPTPRLAGELLPPALGLSYGDLLGLLREAAVARGVRLHYGRGVRDISDDGAKATMTTLDGARHRFDLALIASGMALPTQAGAAMPQVATESLPQQWCHAVLPRPLWLERAAWVIGSDSIKAMLVPVDTRQAGIAVLQPKGSAATAAALRATLALQGRLLRSLGEQWTDSTPTTVRPVRCGVLDAPWHAHGALRIGHSAHVLPPHFGQSAAQTVEDAVVLADLLRAWPQREALLDAFMVRRWERTRQVHDIVVQAARWDLQPEASTDLRVLTEHLAPLVARPA